MKQSIAWHQQNLKNRKRSNKRKRDEVGRLRNQLGDSEKQAQKLEVQINEAIRRKKDGFDEERFMKGDL